MYSRLQIWWHIILRLFLKNFPFSTRRTWIFIGVIISTTLFLGTNHESYGHKSGSLKRVLKWLQDSVPFSIYDTERGWGEVGGAGGRERSSLCSSVCERESVCVHVCTIGCPSSCRRMSSSWFSSMYSAFLRIYRTLLRIYGTLLWVYGSLLHIHEALWLYMTIVTMTMVMYSMSYISAKNLSFFSRLFVSFHDVHVSFHNV